jgi:Fe-S cluster biogenesis protein NfuA
MADPLDDREFRQRMARVEALLHELEQSLDAKARVQMQQILRAVMELHAAALERILNKLAEAGATGLTLIDALAGDDLAASVLLLHGLHPLDLETRVCQALDKVRPLLRSQGGDVELLSLAGGVVRLRLLGSCDSCPSSAMTQKTAIEDAIYAKAPDVAGIEVDTPAKNGHATAAGQERIALPILGH